MLPLLHGYFDGPFLLAWQFDPVITVGLLAAGVIYWQAWRRVQASGHRQPPGWYALAFYSGLAAVAFSLLGPFETYNENLFILHMSQHLVLMQVAAPLLLLGRPVQLVLRALPPARTKQVVGAVFGRDWVRLAILGLTAPVTAFLLFNINLGFWHLPAYYEAALYNPWIHHFEHMVFFGFALLYWWTIIDPVPRHHRMRTLLAMGSVFLSMMVGSIIGAIITLSDSVIYPFYLDALNPWGISQLADQQIGGLIMWVGSGMLYFGVLFALVVRALHEDEARTERFDQEIFASEASTSG
jgi:putative membrane protein